jgi:hypothetical protein
MHIFLLWTAILLGYKDCARTRLKVASLSASIFSIIYLQFFEFFIFLGLYLEYGKSRIGYSNIRASGKKLSFFIALDVTFSCLRDIST